MQTNHDADTDALYAAVIGGSRGGSRGQARRDALPMAATADRRHKRLAKRRPPPGMDGLSRRLMTYKALPLRPTAYRSNGHSRGAAGETEPAINGWLVRVGDGRTSPSQSRE